MRVFGAVHGWSWKTSISTQLLQIKQRNSTKIKDFPVLLSADIIKSKLLADNNDGSLALCLLISKCCNFLKLSYLLTIDTVTKEF